MTDPATLSLADLAAAVDAAGLQRIGCHVINRNREDIAIALSVGVVGALDAYNNIDLLLAAANRLPAVVAECERLRLALDAACDLAAEGISYTGQYHRDKWEMDSRLALITAELNKTETP